ncbi:DUF397 domain-containing protein [Streptomyces phaeochromogenes]|uniref:DUF397 domain-containing protein n=1 Tax=Streptomyces phaeochromogenes TaxID=1923 RepID=UPI0022563298|nr:DUF397 domain-containing protein [Streptomyces phaeochromogenes]MCX5605956.1 DUF397 domain-containing protein [Streptomyces phaeochromogenes]
MPRTDIEVPDSAWIKSSYSGGNETECVEAAFIASSTAIRDSKRPHRDGLLVHSTAWTGFISAVRAGQFG